MTPRTIQSIEFSRPEWVAIPFPGDLPNPGIEPRSPTLLVDSLPDEPPGKPKVKVAQMINLKRLVNLQSQDPDSGPCPPTTVSAPPHVKLALTPPSIPCTALQ